jgi:hypothetical protein
VSAVLAELGRQLAGRWAALLLLPGALYVSALTAAVVLGQRHALDPRPLTDWLDSVAGAPASGRAGTVLIAAAGFTAASAAAGLAASAAARLVERVWWASGRERLLRPFAERRAERWRRAQEKVAAARSAFFAVGGAEGPAADALRAAIVRRDAICPVPASRPTWIGDRLYAVDTRVHTAYHLDLTAVWPRLWLLVPDQVRSELTEARAGCGAAATLTGWGLLCLPLSAAWWPAAVLGAGLLATARHRARLAVGAQADLVEAAVDLYGRDLARQLGIDCAERLTRQAGGAVTSLLRKDLDDGSGRDDTAATAGIAADGPRDGNGGAPPTG